MELNMIPTYPLGLPGDTIKERLQAIPSLIDDVSALNTSVSELETRTSDIEARTTDLEAEIETKANIDGFYETLGVGLANQLNSSVWADDSTPYSFRKTGGGISAGGMEEDEIVGLTLCWNQLVDEEGSNVTIPNGNKYFITHDGESSIASSDGLPITGLSSTDMIIDLNHLFGNYGHPDDANDRKQVIANYIYSLETTSSGDGVAWFKKYFPKRYYSYNKGELMSVQVAAHEFTGFNQFNGTWFGEYIKSSGEEVPSSSYKTTDFIKVLPNTPYYIRASRIDSFNDHPDIALYDANKNFMSLVSPYVYNTSYTIPSNVCYIRIVITLSHVSINNFCVSIKQNGDRDGEFERYAKYTYPLDGTVELHGIPRYNQQLFAHGDHYRSDGTVTHNYIKIKISDTEGLSKLSGSNGWFVIQDTRVQPYNTLTNACWNLRCNRYINISYNQASGGIRGIAIYNNGNIYIRDSSYATLDAFTASLHDNPLVITCLAKTPSTSTATPYQNPQAFYPDGTEEYIDYCYAQNPPLREIAVPPGHISKYAPNLRGKLENAPDSPAEDGDYILHRSQGKNSYIRLPSTFPTAPTANGTYTLKLTISGTTKTLAWST